jgi:hypothetical protein
MSRLKATLVLVALVFIGAVAGLWIRSLGGSAPILPDATTKRPTPSSSPAGTPAASASSTAPAQNPKASLLVRLRCEGKPAPGVSFNLLHEETHDTNRFTTGPDGAHAVLGLPAGMYHVQVDHPDYLDASAHRRVEADRGHEVVLELDRGARLEGKITDTSGRPLEGATIMMLKDHGPSIAPETRTDASGDYRVQRIAAGTYEVRVARTGYRRGSRSNVAFGTGGQILRLDIPLTEGRAISGKVVADDGTPLPGATVIGSNEEISTCRADDHGNFALRELGDGPVSAFASAVGYGNVHLKDLTPGATNVEFRLSKGAIVLGAIVADPTPDNFNVNICLFEREIGQFVPLFNRAGGGAQKEFLFNDLVAGRYRLEVHAPGFRAENVPELELTAGQTVTGIQIRLRKSP